MVRNAKVRYARSAMQGPQLWRDSVARAPGRGEITQEKLLRKVVTRINRIRVAGISGDIILGVCVGAIAVVVDGGSEAQAPGRKEKRKLSQDKEFLSLF